MFVTHAPCIDCAKDNSSSWNQRSLFIETHIVVTDGVEIFIERCGVYVEKV
jgi:hypothetical protein